MNPYFIPASVLLPKKEIDLTKWAVIACDQYTSEPEYWERAENIVGSAPSALSLILPELYLGTKDETSRIDRIHETMREYEKSVLAPTPVTYLYVERTQPDGRVRRGIVGAVDLEQYSFASDTKKAVRATEGTVLSRIPPRVRVRRGAPLELPHVLLLADDPDMTLFEKIVSPAFGGELCYDFDLMLGGGHLRGYLCDPQTVDAIDRAITALAAKDEFLFAVGDGNHSLASAKQHYEDLKKTMTEEEAAAHPARYALCEVESLYDEALDFEPIYRVLFGADPEDVLSAFAAYRTPGEASHCITLLIGERKETVYLPKSAHPLAVGALQPILDEYLSTHAGTSVDYIHGEESLAALAKRPGAVGFLFAGMQKYDLFPSVRIGGSLPRKTFSMGHADDKRFYMEARRIEK